MKPKVFISYSRQNQYIAERLHLDLQRAGCDVWWDQRSIQIGDRWREKIKENIARSDYFLYLHSPEANASRYVSEERELFQNRGGGEELRLRIVGNPESNEVQELDIGEDYWEGLKVLARRLNIGTIESTQDLILRNLSVTEARRELGDLSPRVWTVRPREGAAHDNVYRFVRIPLRPAAYATSWLILEENDSLVLRNDVYAVLKFSGDRDRDVVQEVLDYLNDQPQGETGIPQIVYIEGPANYQEQLGMDRRVYQLPNDKPHIWQDCIDLSVSVLNGYGKRKKHFFMDSPLALTFPIAARLRCMSPYSVYNLDRSSSKNRYQRVYDWNGT